MLSDKNLSLDTLRIYRVALGVALRRLEELVL